MAQLRARGTAGAGIRLCGHRRAGGPLHRVRSRMESYFRRHGLGPLVLVYEKARWNLRGDHPWCPRFSRCPDGRTARPFPISANGGRAVARVGARIPGAQGDESLELRAVGRRDIRARHDSPPETTTMQGPNAMAYAVDLSMDDVDRTLFSPEFEGGEETTMDMEFAGRLFKGMNLDGCLMFAVPVPDGLLRSVPKRVIIDTARSQKGGNQHLPDFGVGPRGGFGLVSEAFVDIVERLEPGKHQFLRIEETLDADRNPIAKRYFIANILARINAVDAEHSSVRIEEKERSLSGLRGKTIVLKTMHWIPAKPRVLAFKRNIVNGHHLWRGTPEDIVSIGFSDVLFESVRAERLSPLEYIHADEI